MLAPRVPPRIGRARQDRMTPIAKQGGGTLMVNSRCITSICCVFTLETSNALNGISAGR